MQTVKNRFMAGFYEFLLSFMRIPPSDIYRSIVSLRYDPVKYTGKKETEEKFSSDKTAEVGAENFVRRIFFPINSVNFSVNYLI